MTYQSKPWLKSYDEDVRHDIEITDRSVVDRLDYIYETYKKQTAFHFLGMSMTYEDLMNHANRFASCLAEHQIKPGSVVAINLPNIPQYLIAMLGTIKAGCIVSGVSPLLTANELIYQLNDSRAKVVVTLDAIFENRLAGIINNFYELKLIIPTNLIDFLPWYKQFIGKIFKKIPSGNIFPIKNKSVISFKTILTDYPSDRRPVELNHDSPCFLQYTGGTTGVPKGALLTHKNMLANPHQFQEWIKLEWGNEKILSGFPMFHAAGLTTALMSVMFGCTQVLIPDPRNTNHIISEFKSLRPTFVANVPTLFLILLRDPEFRKLDFSNVRLCISGAAPFPVDGIRQFEEVIGKGKMIELYGMTETGPIQTVNPFKGVKKIGSVGLPLPSTDICIVDLLSGTKELPIGQEGEIIVRGPQIMKEYFQKPTETEKVLKKFDGHIWMYTGDIGRMDEDGYLFIVDRAKDMINVGGFKVFSREVEDEMYEHPAIQVCAVIAEQNPDRPESEQVKLIVQKSPYCKGKSNADIKNEILAFARDKLSPYKVPKSVEFVDSIPLTAVGKVNKKALR